MALKDLKSDLSWYGKKNPGPYKPNTNANDTKYTNDNGVPGVTITGYSNRGTSNLGFRQTTAANSFFIDNVSLSTRGIATRTQQGGEGFPFLGDIGFSNVARYGESVKRLDVKDNKPILSSGLAFKYTNNSPIDDMYNKFKIREESYNPGFGPKQPFILRGIQRDGNSDPQRYGIGFDDGLVRGGIVTSAERIALDALRISKFLIKPNGLSFMVRQLGMQLSNPNTESAQGTVAAPFANTKKIFTPVNLLANVTGSPLGLRFQRHGVLPLPTTSRYEEVTGKLRPTTAAKKENNRLNKLLNELQPSTAGGGLPAATGVLSKLQKLANKLGFAGQGIKTLSGLTGPGSVYGIGSTQIRRVVDTSLQAQLAGRNKGLDGFGLGTNSDYFFHDKETPYFVLPLTTQSEDQVRPNAKDSLKQKYIAKGVKPITPYFGSAQNAGPIWTTLKFVIPSIISSVDQEKEINNSFTGDPFNLRNTYEASKFLLTGLKSQLARPNLLINDGVLGITEQTILAYTTNNDEPYYRSSTKITVELESSGKPKIKKLFSTAKEESGFKRTGIEAQIASQGGTIIGYGNKDVADERLTTREAPYYHDNASVRTSIDTGTIEGATPDEREENLRKDKTRGKKLKDLSNFWAKGIDEEVNIGAGSTVTNITQKANTSDSPPAGNNAKPVQHYAALSYGQIQNAAKNRNEGSGVVNDFTKGVLEENKGAKNFVKQVTDDKGNPSEYIKESKEAKYNYPESGKAGRDRSNRLKNNVPDKLNAAGWNQGSSNPDPNLKDFINFKFYPIDMGKTLRSATDPIMFRAFIDSISDNIAPGWGENNDQGRADAKIMLETWSRTIDINFRVAAFSASELQALYNKMEALALCAYPDYSGTAGFVGRYIKIHIGDLYKNEPCYITSVAFDWDNETPWELDEGLQVPYYTTVGLSLGWIGNMRPDAQKTKVFSVRSPNPGSKFNTANKDLTRPNKYLTV